MSSVYRRRRLRPCQRERRLGSRVVGGGRINSKSGFRGLYQRGHPLARQISSAFPCAPLQRIVLCTSQQKVASSLASGSFDYSDASTAGSDLPSASWRETAECCVFASAESLIRSLTSSAREDRSRGVDGGVGREREPAASAVGSGWILLVCFFPPGCTGRRNSNLTFAAKTERPELASPSQRRVCWRERDANLVSTVLLICITFNITNEQFSTLSCWNLRAAHL